jgi:protein KRI1
MANFLRKHDDRWKRKGQEVKERKEADEARKREELKRLKALKRKEIMEKIEKLKQITGNDEVGFKVSILQTRFTLQWTSLFTFVCTECHHMIYVHLFLIVKLR